MCFVVRSVLSRFEERIGLVECCVLFGHSSAMERRLKYAENGRHFKFI